MNDRDSMREDLTYLRDHLFRAASYANDVADDAKRMGDEERLKRYHLLGNILYNEALELNADCDEFGVVRE